MKNKTCTEKNLSNPLISWLAKDKNISFVITLTRDSGS